MKDCLYFPCTAGIKVLAKEYCAYNLLQTIVLSRGGIVTFNYFLFRGFVEKWKFGCINPDNFWIVYHDIKVCNLNIIQCHFVLLAIPMTLSYSLPIDTSILRLSVGRYLTRTCQSVRLWLHILVAVRTSQTITAAEKRKKPSLRLIHTTLRICCDLR